MNKKLKNYLIQLLLVGLLAFAGGVILTYVMFTSIYYWSIYYLPFTLIGIAVAYFICSQVDPGGGIKYHLNNSTRDKEEKKLDKLIQKNRDRGLMLVITILFSVVNLILYISNYNEKNSFNISDSFGLIFWSFFAMLGLCEGSKYLSAFLNISLKFLIPLDSNNILKLLLDYGADPNIKIKNNNASAYPLWIALQFLNLDAIKLLLEYGAYPFMPIQDMTLFNTFSDQKKISFKIKNNPKGIISKDYLESLDYIINDRLSHFDSIKEKIAKILGNYRPANSLINAVRKGHPNVVKTLLKIKDYDVNGINKFGDSALIAAGVIGNFEIVAMLLDDPRTNINIQDLGGMTSLMWAAKKGHKKIVNLLKQHGANLRIRDIQRNTALNYAQEELQNAQRTENKAKIENYEAIIRILS